MIDKSYGYVVLNKPSGMTCNEIDNKVKDILNVKKSGHTGTIDSNYTGVLIICFDEALKAMPLLVGSKKEYEGTIYFHDTIILTELKKIIKENFIGEIIQTPPVKSRVKREPRKRTVYSFDILEQNNQEVKFRTQVEAGTYIRKLAHDIGEKLCTNAQLKDLVRTKVGEISLKDSVNIENLSEKNIKPIENLLENSKKIEIKKESLNKVYHGIKLDENDLTEKTELIEGEKLAIILKNKLIAIGLVKNNFIKVDRVLKERKN